MKSLFKALVVSLSLGLSAMQAKAETLTIALGSIAGGGPDVASRLLAKHLPKYLPAGTTVNVTNMPGGGGLIVANYLYNVADPKTTIGSFTILNNTLVNALLKADNVKFDPAKFKWLFSTADGDDNAIVLWANTKRGLKDIKQMMVPNPYVIGSQSVGAVSMQSILVNDILGVKSKYITGYTNNITMAFKNNEVDAYISTLSGAKTAHPEFLDRNGLFRPLVQMGRNTRHPDLLDVPTLSELLTSDEYKPVVDFFNRQTRLARIYVAPPATPDDLVAMYREAAKKVEMDPEFIADAERMHMDHNFIHSEELMKVVADLTNTPKSTLDMIRRFTDIGKK